MTKEIAKKSKLNDRIEQLRELKGRITSSLIAIGALLLDVQTTEVYKEQCESFDEFLGMPEVSFSKATAYKAMALADFVCRKSIDVKEISDIEADKLYRIIKVAETDTAEWLEKARTLSRSDLTEEVRGKKGLPAHDRAKRSLEYVKEFLYEYCVKKKIEPAEMELEELLTTYEKWRRSQG